MTDRRTHAAVDPDSRPQLNRLEGPEGGSGGWRLAAVVLTVLLVGVVAAGRLGMEDGPPAASPAPTVAAAAMPSAEPSGSPEAASSPGVGSRPPLPGGSVDALPDVARHIDGLPTSIGGEKVYRVANALDRGGGRAILVAGWYVGRDCDYPIRCVGRLADNPAMAARSTRSVPLLGYVDRGSGPRVVRAMVDEECWTVGQRSRCVPALRVIAAVWGGDFFTDTGPIGAQPMLSALQFAFPEFRPEPFRDFGRCALPWPPQTYRSTHGGPRMTLVFPTVGDRVAVEAQISANWPRPGNSGAGQCVDHFMSVGEPAGWVSSANVMIWAAHDDGTQALVQAALVDALVNSQSAAADVPAPVTPWSALRGLQRWDEQLDMLPAHDNVAWGADLPAHAYAINDPFVRLLLVFPNRAERRDFQRRIRPGEVIVLHDQPPTQETVGLAMIELRKVNARWLAYRNVLLQVAGPRRFDEPLRDALAEEMEEPAAGHTLRPVAAAR